MSSSYAHEVKDDEIESFKNIIKSIKRNGVSDESNTDSFLASELKYAISVLGSVVSSDGLLQFYNLLNSKLKCLQVYMILVNNTSKEKERCLIESSQKDQNWQVEWILGK